MTTTTTTIYITGNNVLCAIFFFIARTQCEAYHLLHAILAKRKCEWRDIAQR